MKKIRELFQKDIRRKIEEVIKVDQADEDTVKSELDEYIVTDSIKHFYVKMLDEYNAGKASPSEGIGVWISGFFGSGKSSFAKILGYILSAKAVHGENASDVFSIRAQDEQITNLLKIINKNIPTHSVIFDVSMDRGVRTANERIVEVMYKALLRDLEYPEDFDLAVLEMTLEENDGDLERFKKLYQTHYPKKTWDKAKKLPAKAISEASRIMSEMDHDTYPSADTWAKSLGEKGREDITPNLLAERSFNLMAKRKPGFALVFVIDEVGQYVSRSVEKMLDLQAVIQAFGKEGKNRVKAKQAIAPTWIIVTSQEKLDEVVNLLDSSRVEMARLRDRFPISIDLEPTDISEITQKRVLQKTPEAEKYLETIFEKSHGRLNTYCKLHGTSLNSTVTKNSFVSFYPYLPHYVELSIDIMSGIRLQPGAQRHIGGSNRTIIKQAQQMLVNEKVNLADKPLGDLVTLDKLYDIIEGNLSSETKKDISDIQKDFPDNSFYSKVAKAICLLEFTKKVTRSKENIAAVLYPNIQSESIIGDVEAALKALEESRYIKSTGEGYKLQSLKERDWDLERKAIDVLPGNKNKIKRTFINEIFSSDTKLKNFHYKTKTFKTGCIIDDIVFDDEGDLPINILVADDIHEQEVKSKESREQSREDKNKNRIYLLATLTEDIHNLIEEVFRSDEMINKYSRIESQEKLNPEDRPSLVEEKRRKDTISRELKSKLYQILSNGKIYFRGIENDNSALGKELPEILNRFFTEKILDLYQNLEMGALKLKGDEAEKILLAVNLNGLPQVFYSAEEGALNLVTKQGDKFAIDRSAPIAQAIFGWISEQYSYGEKTTGKEIEEHFRGFDYGWDRDVLRVVLAALFRAGAIEVTFQGRRYSSYADPSSRQPFTNNTAFRSALFTPKKLIDSKTLADAARNYEDITGSEVDVEEGAIAQAFKQLASRERENILPIRAILNANNLPGREFVSQYSSYIEGILESAPDDCVKLLATDGKTFKDSLGKAKRLGDALSETTLETIRLARNVIQRKFPVIEDYCFGSEDLQNKVRILQQFLDAETFYERMAEITDLSRELSKIYSDIYRKMHLKRDEAYFIAYDELKGRPEWPNLTQDQMNTIGNSLKIRSCLDPKAPDYEIPFDEFEIFCSKCHSTIAQMESEISAVSNLKQNAIEKLIELSRPAEEKVERVKVIKFLGSSITENNFSEFNEGLKELKDHIIKLLKEGKTVILE